MIDTRNEFLRIGDGPDFLEFERIENPPSQSGDLCALLLLDKLVPGKKRCIAAAEHDQIWLSYDLDELDEVATADDILYLYRCGVFYEESNDSLSMFR